jgi:hypothetical protein
MFKTLYRCARTAARHENGPAARSRLAYLEHLAAGGATALPARERRCAVSCGCLHESGRYESSGALSSRGGRDGMGAPEVPQRNGIQSGADREGISLHHLPLVALRRAVERASLRTPHQAELDAYCRYMTEERGLAQATVTTPRSELPKFLKYTAGKTLKQMRLADVEIFLAHRGKNGWTRHGINSMAHIICGFFKYGETQRWIKPGIGAEIHGPRVYRREFLPLGPSWPDVQRLYGSLSCSSTSMNRASAWIEDLLRRSVAASSQSSNAPNPCASSNGCTSLLRRLSTICVSRASASVRTTMRT